MGLSYEPIVVNAIHARALKYSSTSFDFGMSCMKPPGADIFAIGVGHGAKFRELNAMASKPSHEFSFRVSDFQALSTIEKMFAQSTCNGR